MKNTAKISSLLCLLGAFLAFAAVPCAFAAPAASSVLVLPFKGEGPNAADAARGLPELVAGALKEQGFRTLSPSSLKGLSSQQKSGTISAENARQLARRNGADYAVYGVLTSAGDSFSVDARMASVKDSSSAARPYFVQRGHLVELNSAAGELASSIAGSLPAPVSAAPAAKSAGPVSSAPLKPGAIAGVKINGLKILDPDAILMRLNTSKGDVVNEDTINEETKRLWDTGYFSDVNASVEQTGEGRMLVFNVVEKPRISDVKVNGSDAVSKSDILSAMSSKTGSVLNDKLLSQDIQKVTDLYRKKGYYLAEVTYHVEERPNSASAVLVFDVKEGNKLYIKDVSIDGLETIREKDIKKDLALKERGMFSFFTKTGVLRDEYIERDTAAITAYGLNHGYTDMQVAAPDISYEEDGIVIKFHVKEGRQYKIGEIAFGGDLIDTPDRLMEIIQLDTQKEKEGYFALNVMQDDIKKLTDFYADYGYAFASVTPQTKRSEDGEHLDVRYMIDKKQKVYIRRVKTEGNTRTRDNVILREMRLGDGDLLDGAKIRRSNERLTRLRYFSAIDTALEPTGNPGEVDVNVRVKEDQTGSVMGGVGYSSYNKFGVTASIEERNLFGKGYNLSLTGFTSARSTSLDLSFINPRLYDSDFGLGWDAYVVRQEWDDFNKKTLGSTIHISYPIGEYTSVGVGYRLDRYTLYNIPETASRAYKEYEGKNLSSVASARVVYDSTDSKQVPSKGFIFRSFTEYGGGGLGGNDNFIKPLVELQGFHSIFSKNHVFHWKGRLGAVYKNTSKPVPVFDRFFIGGIDSIRGYDTEDISPRDREFDDEIGGDRMGFLNLEYIWTVEPELGIALVPFFDIGFQNDSEQSKAFTNFKRSVGLELRWRSPMGDLRFAYGYPLDKSVRGEKLNGRFEFSMGQNF